MACYTIQAPTVTHREPTWCTPPNCVQVSVSATGEEPGLRVFQPVRGKSGADFGLLLPVPERCFQDHQGPSGDQSSTPWPCANSPFVVSHWSWLFLTCGFLGL